MYISKLRISGFKSFSEDTSISISNGLNGIIGPNGSGKSNIVEAIKWVMGESSSKSLRGTGLNDFIFNGSVSKASKNIALVSLTIEVDKSLIAENYKKFLKDNIIEVERQVIRDSGSTYKINGKEVKAKDIQFLFADLSSGSRSSNIIDQGTVGNLVLQKPIERRRILDEAAGISGISARKKETNSKLQATKRNIDRLSDILIAKRKNLSDLQRQAKKAKFYREVQKEIDGLKETLLVAKWKRTKNQIILLQNQLTDINVALNAKRNKLNELERIAINENKKLTDLEKEKKNINEKNLVLKLDIEKINFEINSKKNDLMSLSNLKIQINKSINFQEEILDNSKKRLEELNSETALLNTTKKESLKQKEAKAKLASLQNTKHKLDKEIREQSVSLNQEKHLVSQLEFEKPILENKISELSKNVNTLKNNLDDKLILKKTNPELENLISLIKKDKAQLVSNNHKKSDILGSINNIKKELSVLIALVEQECSDLDKKKIIINDIEREISNYLSLGYKTTASNILQEVKIEKGYRLAFCLAMGDGIEADNNSNSDVKWLDMKNIEHVKLPEDTEPLSNFVKGPKKLESFLTQVAIVKDNKQGNKLHKKLKNGQLAVTQDGSLWRWDGLVIIDGKKTLTYKRIESTTKILELEKELSQVNKEYSFVNNKKIENEKKIEMLNKKLSTHESNLSILYNNNDKLQILLNDSDKKKFILENQINNLDEEIKKLETAVSSQEEELLKSRKNIDVLIKNISIKSSSILEINKILLTNKNNLAVLEKELEEWQINYALEKQKNDTLLLKNNKNLEEIKETNKKNLSILETVQTLKQDLKEADEKITLIKLNPSHSNNKIELLKSKIRENNINLENLNDKFNSIEKVYIKTSENTSYKKNQIEELKEKSIRKDTQVNELLNYLGNEETDAKNDLNINLDDPKYLSDSKYDINIKDSEFKLKRLKLKTDEYNDINFSAEKDYIDLEKEVTNLDMEESDLTKAAKKLEKAIEELNKESRSRIVNSFNEINTTFSSLFKKLFNGGKAYLELIDSTDPLEAGLELMVSPPGKKLQKLSLLSGGEKALASLALIFSTFINKPSPICILDEVDAPLDEGNVEKFCELLNEATKVSSKRFLVVTHNKITMGYMNKLYGITMLEPGSSKVLSVNLDDAESVYAAE